MLADDRPLYPIGTVARMLDVAPATLRTWEQRYGQIVPSRDDGGRRLYSRADVARLRFVKSRMEEGLTPSRAHELLGEWGGSGEWMSDLGGASGDFFSWTTSRPELLDRLMADVLQRAVDSTGVACAFLEVNFEHPEFGLCSSLVRRAFSGGREPDPGASRFAAVPWSSFPEQWERLARGEPVAYQVRELGEEGRKIYEGVRTRSEVNVPLEVDGEWVGVVGLADDQERDWGESDLRLLRAAASIVEAEAERYLAERRFRALTEGTVSV